MTNEYGKQRKKAEEAEARANLPMKELGRPTDKQVARAFG